MALPYKYMYQLIQPIYKAFQPLIYMNHQPYPLNTPESKSWLIAFGSQFGQLYCKYAAYS
jgi:hypothetical protein